MSVAESSSGVLAGLGLEHRARLGRLWLERCRNELDVSAHFVHVQRSLDALGSAPELRALGAAAISEELRHAELCFVMAKRYLEQEVSFPDSPVATRPCFPNCDERTSHLLTVVQHCCFSETIASAYLKACRLEATDDEVKPVLSELLADEISHSRIGWGVLATATAFERATLKQVSGGLLRSAAIWISDADEDNDIPTGHGFLRGDALRAVFFAACEELILPGLTHCGINPARAEQCLGAMRSRVLERAGVRV